MSDDRLVSPKERLYEACKNGQMDVIDSLLEAGVDVNAFTEGKLPLHRACKHTEPWAVDVVTKLITRGADVDLEDEYRWNALDHALNIVPFQPHIAQLLLDCSKKGINRLDSNYYDYLQLCASLDAIKFLVENGIDVNYVCDNETYLDSTYRDNACSDRSEYLRSVGAKLYSEL